jgi:stage II sporulation protein AB (anti-sigma F factor)
MSVPPLRRTHFELSTPATSDSVRQLRRRVAEIAELAGADEDVVDDVQLCVNEALANVLLHAYESTSGALELEADVSDGELVVVVRDHGRGFADAGPSQAGSGYGLTIIDALSARSSVRSTPGRGTEVSMTFGLGSA